MSHTPPLTPPSPTSLTAHRITWSDYFGRRDLIRAGRKMRLTSFHPDAQNPTKLGHHLPYFLADASSPRDGLWLGLDATGTAVARANFTRPLTPRFLTVTTVITAIFAAGLITGPWSIGFDITAAAATSVALFILALIVVGGRGPLTATIHRPGPNGYYGSNFSSTMRGTGLATSFALDVHQLLGSPPVVLHVHRNHTTLHAHYQRNGLVFTPRSRWPHIRAALWSMRRYRMTTP